ncbi:MAG: hypothetical protein CMG00_06125 [Candidatus Marinimicrobia bacterium]|nr:hypothetical protein [Candidatus Neomarinimicrobiota bacterium]|tara:strand:+ start:1999 stop:2823 length:825 start_codon:yes stop_codon:yes gene_type:complete
MAGYTPKLSKELMAKRLARQKAQKKLQEKYGNPFEKMGTNVNKSLQSMGQSLMQAQLKQQIAKKKAEMVKYGSIAHKGGQVFGQGITKEIAKRETLNMAKQHATLSAKEFALKESGKQTAKKIAEESGKMSLKKAASSAGGAATVVAGAGEISSMFKKATTGAGASGDTGTDMMMGATTGGLSGAQVGSMFAPGVGTAIGAATGAILGGIAGGVGAKKAREKQYKAQKAQAIRNAGGMMEEGMMRAARQQRQSGSRIKQLQERLGEEMGKIYRG